PYFSKKKHEQRRHLNSSFSGQVLVSLAGIGVIGMATGCAFGLGFYFQLKFNDMTPIIPFLLLGIGVDDMFVIGKH
ncbi:MAG: hypothetical protein ACK56I_16255, partial [bacterium]